ncbi:hypothetical protein C8F01DRAFT_1332018 [Mycena amicta]|nr:hypothetical protein C8F01DRAFT_1332018 [Mycena amicta]
MAGLHRSFIRIIIRLFPFLAPELGGSRTFSVHLSAAYNPTTPHALVVSFHGGVLINGKGIVAVYPEGQFRPGKNGNESIRAWQGAPYSPPGVDDKIKVAFTRELLSHLSDNLCLDSNRFYASGKSNEGGFTNLLKCTPQTANLFAAFAPVSPTLYAGADYTDCAPTPPYPSSTSTGYRIVLSHSAGRGPQTMSTMNLTLETTQMRRPTSLSSVKHGQSGMDGYWYTETTPEREGEAYFSKKVSSVHGGSDFGELSSLNLATHALALAKSISRLPLVALRIRTPSVPPTFLDAGAEFAQAMPLAFFDGEDSLRQPSLTVTVFDGQCRHSVRRKRSRQRCRTPTRI